MATVHQDTDIPIDLDRLAEWMDGNGLGEGAISSPVLLTGGTQNILMRFERGDRSFVLRRPPANPRPGNNETMRREARVLGALAETNVPHPRLIAACSDDDVLGVAFYLMEPVDGINPVVEMPQFHASDPAVRRAMGFALVDGAAALGQVDYLAVDLGNFGNADNYLGRQIERWSSQLEGYRSHEGWPGPEGLPGVAVVANYLAACLPKSFKPGIIHGDYSIGNVMYQRASAKLAAIVDWELATIGDPLIDLGWIAATWRGAGGPDLPVLIVEPFDGFPTIEEMVAHYAKSSDRDLSNFDWYAVLACFKLAIILEGTFARACAGKAPIATGKQLHDTSVKLMQRALYRIG